MKKPTPCKKINHKIKIKSELSPRANFVGLFDYTYNDIINSKKITLEDVGVLAYGCFIHYEPIRIKWFKQFTDLAKTRPDTPIWRLLQIRHKKFGVKEPKFKEPIEKPIEHAYLREGMDRSNVFILRKSTDKGTSPLTVGFIVSPKPAGKCVVVYKLCEDEPEKNMLITGSHAFNHLYPGSGTYHGYFIVKNEKDFWQREDFEITVNPNPSKDGDIITNFYQTKAAGITESGASGLDVAISISSGITVGNIEWDFGETKPKEPKKKSIDQTAKHVYKNARKDPYEGKVTVTNHEGNKLQQQRFYVIMGKI